MVPAGSAARKYQAGESDDEGEASGSDTKGDEDEGE